MSTSLVLAAWRGQEARTLELIGASLQDALPESESRAIALAEYARAVLYNGLGDYQAARFAAERACEHEHLGLFDWALTELVEASARSGRVEVAALAVRQLEERTVAGGTDWALGVQARSRAVISHDEDADALYREAIERLAGKDLAPHLARAQLLYGEWLRREGRRVDAREQLRAAHATFSRIGAGGFAERARRELLATGETVRKRAVILIGMGLGFTMAPAMNTATLGVTTADAGVASATVNTMQQVGGSLGTALFSTLSASAATGYLAGNHPGAGVIAQATVHGYTVAFWWAAAIFAAGAIVCGLLLRPGAPRVEPDPIPVPAA